MIFSKTGATETSPSVADVTVFHRSFYDCANKTWLEDPEVVIPDEYSSWGSFLQLHDSSLKTQVSLCKELGEAAENENQRKVALIWSKSMGKFAEWNEGVGDLGPIKAEVEEMMAALRPLDEPASWSDGLAKWFARCSLSGIGLPLDFDKVANLEDSENVVLEVGPAGLSLPSRCAGREAERGSDRQRGRCRGRDRSVGRERGAERRKGRQTERDTDRKKGGRWRAREGHR